MTWFHGVICERLQRFARKEIKKLMVFMPPQNGKSEVATRSFPPYLFGLNPNLRIAVLSYAASKAKKFNREIQQRLTSPRYQVLFPAVRLASARDEAVARTTEQFDLVGYDGSLKSVGRQGPLTGDPVDVAILDDLLKDRLEAQSLTIRENAWNWIVDVVETRFHNDSQLLYVTTRWDEDDPAGRFLERDGYRSVDNPSGWEVVSFAALKTADIVPYDQRPVGAALWPERHSLERLQAIQQNSPLTFNSLYQQDPRPSTDAMVFPDWIEVDEFPACDVQFAGMDFGYSNDPTTLIRIGINGRDLYLDELIYETGLTNPAILQRAYLAKVSRYEEVIADNAEPKSIEEIRHGTILSSGEQLAGLNIKACTKGPGSINAGIQKLNEYRVHYTKRSLNLRREIRNYQWIMAGGVATNTPIDAYNHALDAVRSAVYTKYTTPMSGPRITRPIRKNTSYFSR
ncbi:terminase large subunit [Spirosoma spitsbergense]|uniref:terminase large subunit n=1 Tax=Spirosoma spitsbergense TaxID=431554 RepID=UPI0003807713|nr:terminase large subunit [Spirosoma spitsbergense]